MDQRDWYISLHFIMINVGKETAAPQKILSGSRTFTFNLLLRRQLLPGLYNSQVPHPTKSLDFGPGGPAPILSCVFTEEFCWGPF